jgi:hypothetical protein
MFSLVLDTIINFSNYMDPLMCCCPFLKMFDVPLLTEISLYWIVYYKLVGPKQGTSDIVVTHAR